MRRLGTFYRPCFSTSEAIWLDEKSVHKISTLFWKIRNTLKSHKSTGDTQTSLVSWNSNGSICINIDNCFSALPPHSWLALTWYTSALEKAELYYHRRSLCNVPKSHASSCVLLILSMICIRFTHTYITMTT